RWCCARPCVRRSRAAPPLGGWQDRHAGVAMTSKLATDLISREGLAPLVAMREHGVMPAGAATFDLLARCSILALGAAADVARRRECGGDARIHVPCAPQPS